jgi:hypothetical protein
VNTHVPAPETPITLSKWLPRLCNSFRPKEYEFELTYKIAQMLCFEISFGGYPQPAPLKQSVGGGGDGGVETAAAALSSLVTAFLSILDRSVAAVGAAIVEIPD